MSAVRDALGEADRASVKVDAVDEAVRRRLDHVPPRPA
jgi:hypothetical protein